MSKNIRKLLSLFLSVGLLITGLASGGSPAVALPNEVHVKVHYHRDAGDYTGWDLFLWKNVAGTSDGATPSANFTGTDAFGVFAESTITEAASYLDIGFIIRKGGGSWTAKDGANCKVGSNSAGDRFLTPDANGNVEVWILSGDCEIYTEAQDVVAPSPQIISASVDDLDLITVSVNSPIDLTYGVNGGFSLSGGLTISSVTAVTGSTSAASTFTIRTASDIPFGQSFTLTHVGADAEHTYGSSPLSVGNVMNSDGFNDLYEYTGHDLGATYSVEKTDFKLWAPIATAVTLVAFSPTSGSISDATLVTMTQGEKGTWSATLEGDQKGRVYMYKVTRNGSTVTVIDPYARSTIADGDRAVVVDLESTNPAGWSVQKPEFSGNPVDASIYELHVRDFSKDSSSGIPAAHRGKYLAFTDNNTSYSWSATTTDPKTKKKVTKNYSTKTGVAAIKDLGVTHVQLLPIYDFASGGIESNPTFNWGYDPLNFNTPEGGYSSDASNPTARISELKSAINNLHANGLRVIMDVVYNHVADAGTFSMEQITPGYFFRRDANGTLLNGTGCGNETASERPMVRKFIVDSVKYWASQYKLDGFRFDLMGILDVTTMQQVRAAVDDVDPSIIILGEGWNMGGLPDSQRASQVNIQEIPGVAAFNDQIRDGIKGSVFNASERGWATGNSGRADDVKAGITGNTNFSRYVSRNWTTSSPGQSINYVEAHDNLTLADKISASVTKNVDTRAKLQRFAGSIAALAQGVPFMQAGQEWQRTKSGDDNSYTSGDTVNMLRYKQRVTFSTTYNYYKGILALRAKHKAFRMTTSAAVKANLKFLSEAGGVIGYSLNGSAVGDSWKSIVVIHNPNTSTKSVALPTGKFTWYVVVKGDKAGLSTIQTLKNPTKVSVEGQSTVVLYHK